MGNSGAGGSTKVEHLGTWLHVDVTNTANDGGGNLGSKWVPDSVFSFDSVFTFFSLYLID